MDKREDTHDRLIRRKYEKTHKEERDKATLTFGTNMPRGKVIEINEFLAKNNLSKVFLIEVGYKVLKEQLNNNKQ